jgi:ABC-type multidrug transport system permease subunit
MNGFLSMVRKEFTHFRRDFATLILAVLVPIIQLVIFGYAIDFDVRHIRTVVVDYDRSPDSRDYLNKLQATGYLDIIARKATPEEAAQSIRSGYARVAVIIPPGFSKRKGIDQGASVGVLIDGSDNQIATRARLAFVPPPTLLSREIIEARINVLFNPDMRTHTFTIPGLIGVILQIVTVSLTGLSLVREREQGSLEQLMLTPISRLALMFGKLVPFAVLAFFEMLLVLTAGHFLFDIHVKGSLILLALLTIPFIMAGLSLGLFISTIAANQPQALQMSLLITLPSVLLSGFVFPRETMPGALYLLSLLLPVTHYIEIVRGIIVRDAGFWDLLPNMLTLCLITAALVSLAATKFRKSIA